jgi:pimeloyl-ACP methyl ester carboxylesterase
VTSTGALESTPRRRRVRRLLAGLAVLVLLFAVLLGGGGWYFADQIRSDALTADHEVDPQRYDLQVTVYGDGEVALRRTGAQPELDLLRTTDVIGLLWPGGSGMLTGAPTDLGDGTVARALQVVSGAAPAAGTVAALENRIWTDPQQAYGAGYEDVTFPCAGGECPAWYVPGTSSTWFIGVHGKGSSRAEPLRALGPALEQGLPALLIEYRNDPDAPADPSGHYRYGATEWHDLEQAVAFALDHGAEHVVLFGASMGGAIVASFLEHSTFAPLVTGVVLDAPALDLSASVAHEAAQRTLPVLGTGVPDVLTGTAEWIAGWRFDVDWDAVDYLPGDWLHVPALVFHGTDDDTVPLATSDELRAAYPDLVEVVAVAGAGHVESWNRNPADYTDREGAFLACVTAPVPAGSCTSAG